MASYSKEVSDLHTDVFACTVSKRIAIRVIQLFVRDDTSKVAKKEDCTIVPRVDCHNHCRQCHRTGCAQF